MTGGTGAEPLSLDTALSTCQQVQADAGGRPWLAAWWRCAGCRTAGLIRPGGKESR